VASKLVPFGLAGDVNASRKHLKFWIEEQLEFLG